jgi:N-acetylmuramoyl-L-alanine amidase
MINNPAKAFMREGNVLKKIGGAFLIALYAIICFYVIIGFDIFTGKSAYAQNSRIGDVQLLARAINGEARGESYEGQVAVGAVILNRVKDSKFPNTIAGVIYQPGAFTAVSDGQINVPLDPDSTVVKAAQDALDGWDPTGGAIYYWNPATATSSWIWSRKVVKQIGKHYFGV